MNMVSAYGRELRDSAVSGWNRFWFSAVDPATFCLIRLLAGGMLFYTHLVYTQDLLAFFGPHPWVNADALNALQVESGGAFSYGFSYLWFLGGYPTLLWITHIAALVVFAMLMLGWHSRVVSVLGFIIMASYANRSPASLFGLDQINGLLAMYLMLGPSGARYSIDRWLQKRRWKRQMQGLPASQQLPVPEPPPSIGANVGLRFIQLHMCVIYMFAGLGKLQGVSWWNGTAMWGSVANLEYQSLDMTWMYGHTLLMNVMTLVTVWWEISYSALIWPRLTRPIVLALAVPLHLGIAIFLGMITFGTVMLFGNLAFVSPRVVRAIIDRRSLTLEPSPETPATVDRPRRRKRGKNSSAAAMP